MLYFYHTVPTVVFQTGILCILLHSTILNRWHAINKLSRQCIFFISIISLFDRACRASLDICMLIVHSQCINGKATGIPLYIHHDGRECTSFCRLVHFVTWCDRIISVTFQRLGLFSGTISYVLRFYKITPTV